MEITHYLYLASPPRPTFVSDMTPAEYEIILQHFAFMDRVRDDGKLLLTGPSLDGAWGIAIFKVTAQSEAERLVAADPAVRAGLFTPALHPMSIKQVTP
jgi:uncharacterized protein YciI